MSDSTNDDLTEVILKLDEHLERPLWCTEFREFLTKVRSVLVAPGHRGQGIARQVVAAWRHAARSGAASA